MTIQSQTTRVDYTGNGATTNFPVPFYWLQDTDLLVIRTDNAYTPPTVATLALTTDYVVTGSGNQSGGSITTTVAPTATQKLSILRNVPFTQLTHYVPNDPFPAASHEQALDKLTMETQQLNEGLSRSITLPPNATGLSTNLPLPVASQLIGWNPTATALQNVDPTTIATSVTYGNAVADKFSGDGTTVNFNLSANPGGVNNLDVSISGVTQRPGIDYTWTTGTTLTFTTAPPAGTNNILVRYAQALPIGSLGVGQVVASNLAAGAVGNAALAANAVKDANVDPAAAVQSSKLAYSLGATGSVTRAVQSKLQETTGAADFGAKLDGTTDDTAAWQAYINWCLANGRNIKFRGSTVISSTLLIDLTTTPSSWTTGALHVALEGDSISNSEFVWKGADAPAIWVKGNYPGADLFTAKGFRVRRQGAAPTGATGAGSGLRLESLTIASVADFAAFNFSNGIEARTIENAVWTNVFAYYNFNGLIANNFGASAAGSNTNTFVGCNFIGNTSWGVKVDHGTLNAFYGGTFQSNGTMAAGGGGMAITNSAYDGGVGLVVDGVYFEGNAGSMDAYIQHLNPCVYSFKGNTFNRLGNTSYVSANIQFDCSALGAGGAKCVASLVGNSFRGFGSYAANSSRPTISFVGGSGYDGWQISENGNDFWSATDAPVWPSGSAGPMLHPYLVGTLAYTLPATGAGASQGVALTVQGAAVGDPVSVGFTGGMPPGWLFSAQVTSANTVTVTMTNNTGATSTATAGTLRAAVFKF